MQLLQQLGVGSPVEDQASVRVHERDAKCVANMATVRVLFSSLDIRSLCYFSDTKIVLVT